VSSRSSGLYYRTIMNHDFRQLYEICSMMDITPGTSRILISQPNITILPTINGIDMNEQTIRMQFNELTKYSVAA